MEARRDTRKQIVDLAENHIKTKGYFGFSYKDIAQTLQVKNAAIHYHFPSKEDLGREVLDREIRRFLKWKEGQTPRARVADRLENFFGIYEHHLNCESSACLVGASAVVFSVLPPSLREKADELAEELLRYLSHLLKEGREAKALTFTGSPEDKASLVASALAGGLQLAKIKGKPFFYNLKDQLLTELINP